MRKVEMINIMIVLGVVKEEDRNYLMRKTIKSLLKNLYCGHTSKN